MTNSLSQQRFEKLSCEFLKDFFHFRRHFREVLKQQMSDQDVSKKHELKQKVKETERAIAYDRECRMNDAHEYFRKHNYLMQFRDGNKNVSTC